MIDFFTSVSWVGWTLMVVFALALWQLPALLREALSGDRGAAEHPMQPGENPPHLNSSVPIRTGTALNDTMPGTDPQ